MKQQDIQHLYWRAGFGATPNQLKNLSAMDKHQVVDALFQNSSSSTPLEIDTTEIERFTVKSVYKDKSKRREFVKISNQKLKVLNTFWVNRMVTTEALLREKMTLFWANHFVCRGNNIFYVQQYNNTLRNHALGNFGDFVKAISKEATMLKYLNNKQNRKRKPNENFARELMELFTLGEGHYTEEDIKESAKAFTGYSHNFEGEFVLRKFQHDYDFKTFFGHTGRYDGDDIIDMILEQKQCARFICRKIYSYFVNDIINENRVEELATVFYKDYNIKSLMRHLFMSDWFYSEKNIGSKIKSPIDFLVGMIRTVPVEFEKPQDVIKIQKLLGQILLNPPNVAGWKGGKSWIDSNTIMLRLKLPSIILANAKISIKEKGDFEDSFETYYSKKKKNKFVTTAIDWETFETACSSFSFDDLKQQLVIPELSEGTATYVKTLSQNSKRNFCVQLMSLPEYQMC
ncbi:DUF1800 domain-containing protein [Psychroserpens ponticola]|uniref:DUF1800 domain-containing protein n=1 Tax=Psychroserpens ponticola TaxID=2932268 RepID=A0ABY7RXM0_9FLAO|nr:DUF1800 domain-containing protein [Psychroserpens ponticola]WCO01868.1 DUF1800 domain-containing protein [Psychroserpens ponticola]